MPVKAAVAVLTKAPVRIKMDVIWINGAIAGRWYTFAKKPEIEIEKTASTKPRISSKAKPEAKTLRILCVSFSLLYWAEYLIIAVLMPQSLKVTIRLGAATAMA